MGFVKRNAVAIGIGAAVLVGGSYVGAHALTTPRSVSLDDASSGAEASPAPSAAERGLIRGEGVAEKRDGTFATVQFNRGVLQSIDGTTLVVAEADGKTVRLDTTPQTRFRRDGKRASLSDLQAGDHVAVLGTEDGDKYVTKMVRAFSPDAWSQRQQLRAQRRGQ